MTRPAKLFAQYFGDPTGAVVARAPGRVNLIGEHTDYNEGLVLPMIIDRHVEAIARKRQDRTVRLVAADLDERVEAVLGEAIDFDGPGWLPYVFGMVKILEQRGMLNSGVDIVVRGTVPSGAGLASSAALEVSVALALEGAFNLWIEPTQMAKLCLEAEHRFAGVHCGIMDQFASRIGRPEHALYLDCRSLEARHVPLPLENHRVVIVDSGVRRELGDTEFNRRREECEQAVVALQQVDPSIVALRDVGPELLDAHGELLEGDLLKRSRHVVLENSRVTEACAVLAVGDLDAFGRLMRASHLSLRDDYEVSHPALDRLVETASTIDGVCGSRLTGAGFGGCTIHVTSRDTVESLISALQPILADLPGSSCMTVGLMHGAGVAEVIP